MNNIIVLDKDHYTLINGGCTVQSSIIHVPVGYTALLSLYNMTNIVKMVEERGEKTLVNNSCLMLKKISYGIVEEATRVLACDENINLVDYLNELLANRRVFLEPIYQNCCEWTISPSSNYTLLPVPGFFVLETDDVDQLDTMYVEYSLISAEQSIAIPNGFKLGK